MILIDTTVLVYAVGAVEGPRDANRRLLEAIRDERVRATTTAEVIQEFAHVYARRRSRKEAARLATDYADLLSPLIAVERRDLDEGLVLFERLAALGAFDAVLAAVALNRGAEAIVSADGAFAHIPRLRHVDPVSSLDELLGA